MVADCSCRSDNSPALAEATIRFLTDSAFQIETRRRAYDYAKPMAWPNVGRQLFGFIPVDVVQHE